MWWRISYHPNYNKVKNDLSSNQINLELTYLEELFLQMIEVPKYKRELMLY